MKIIDDINMSVSGCIRDNNLIRLLLMIDLLPGLTALDMN